MTIAYRIPLRIVFYNEFGDWVAHCLEFDLCGHGASKAKALKSLAASLRLQVLKAIEFGNWENLFTGADPDICERFFAGKDVAGKSFRFLPELPESVEILDIAYREYVTEPTSGSGSGHDLAAAH